MCCITLNQFCGLSLPSASIVIGWLSAIISMLQGIGSVVILVCLNEIVDLAFTRFGKDDVALEMVRIFFCVYVSLYLGVSVLDLVASVLVIMGTNKESHLMLLPWLINNMFALVVRVPFCFLWIISIFNSFNQIDFALVLLAFWGVHCWIWTAIYSHFKEMRKSKDMLLALHQQVPANMDAEAARY